MVKIIFDGGVSAQIFPGHGGNLDIEVVVKRTGDAHGFFALLTRPHRQPSPSDCSQHAIDRAPLLFFESII